MNEFLSLTIPLWAHATIAGFITLVYLAASYRTWKAGYQRGYDDRDVDRGGELQAAMTVGWDAGWQAHARGEQERHRPAPDDATAVMDRPPPRR